MVLIILFVSFVFIIDLACLKFAILKIQQFIGVNLVEFYKAN